MKVTETPSRVSIEEITKKLGSSFGAVFSSGYEYPGRHSRWDIAFVTPAVKISSKEHTLSFQPLTTRGRALVSHIKDVLENSGLGLEFSNQQDLLTVTIERPEGFFTEEERPHVPSVFSILRALISAFKTDATQPGLFGAFGYDLVFQFEDLEQKKPRGDQPDMELFFPLEITVCDRKKEVTTDVAIDVKTKAGWLSEIREESLVSCPVSKSYPEDSKFEVISDHTPEEFMSGVRQVVEGTKKGDYFEVVLSQTFSANYSGTPADVFRRISKINPSPYMFFVNFGTHQLVGASPEIYVRVTGERFETCPIAGTIKRGESAVEDARKVMELLSSEKEESELTMCTDVDRNDMARVCKPGSVKVIGRRQLEFYSHLIHTVDHVEGELAGGFDALDAFQSHMWACTVTGAPKPAAMQEIENLEKTPRGYYSGAVGVLGFNGDVNTGIMLRTALLKDGQAHVRAGATLLYGSDPKAEEQECRTKAAGLLSALHTEKQKQTKVSEELRVPGLKVLLVDFRDSFVHNLAAYMRSFGCEVKTVRSVTDELIKACDVVVLSPGPFVPAHFNMSPIIEKALSHKKALFGVCLGHQGICEYFGASLGTLTVPMHGKETTAEHSGDNLFKGIPKEFPVARYHSVYVTKGSVPETLQVISNTKEDSPVIMGIRHKELPVASVQFHPESLIMQNNELGRKLLFNVLTELTK